MTHDDADAVLSFEDALDALRPGDGPRGARRAEHRVEDVLRLPDGVRRRAEHPGLPDLPRACPARCRSSTRKAVESAIRIGLALNCEIAEWCRFARKNYFYPDMPKNFQTSQYDEPIAFDGWTRRRRRRRDRPDRDRARAHGGGHRQVAARRRRHRPHPRRGLLAGRLQPGRHPADRDRHQDRSRAPARRRPLVARAYVAQLRDLLLGLGVSDVRMEQGSLRCDVNLSLRAGRLGGARHPHRDQERQLAALGRAGGALRDRPAGGASSTAGGSILQETRHWHEDTGITTLGPREVRRRGLPLLPRARPGAGRAVARVGRGAAGHAARAAARAPRPAAGRLGLLRPRDARHRRRRRARAWSRRPSPPAPRRRPPASGGSPSWPAGPTSRASSSPRSAITPAAGRPGPGAGRRGPDQRQAGPPGVRRRARRRGHARRGRRGARARGRLRRGRALGDAVDRAIDGEPRRGARRSATARWPPPAR